MKINSNKNNQIYTLYEIYILCSCTIYIVINEFEFYFFILLVLFILFLLTFVYFIQQTLGSDSERRLFDEPVDTSKPMDILEEEELERISGLLQRDNLVRGLGIVEHVYRLLHCTPGTMGVMKTDSRPLPPPLVSSVNKYLRMTAYTMCDVAELELFRRTTKPFLFRYIQAEFLQYLLEPSS
jgi:hypothetical protein